MDAVIEYVEAALNINNNPQSAKEKLNNLNLIINNFLKTIHSPDFILNNQVGVAVTAKEKEPSPVAEDVNNDFDMDFHVKPLKKRVQKQEKFIKNNNIKKTDNKNSKKNFNQINDQKIENNEVSKNENSNIKTEDNSQNQNSNCLKKDNKNNKDNPKNKNSKCVKKDNKNNDNENSEEEEAEEEEFF